jgi:hypothetical protein
LLEDEDKKQFVCHLWQGPGGPTTGPPLARLALQGLFWRIQQSRGSGKRREQMRKFCMRQAGRARNSRGLSWKVV